MNGKIRKKLEWKCVIESTCLLTSQHLVLARMVKTCPKKGQQEKIFFCTLNMGQLPIYQRKKSFTFYIPFKNLHIFKEFMDVLQEKTKLQLNMSSKRKGVWTGP